MGSRSKYGIRWVQRGGAFVAGAGLLVAGVVAMILLGRGNANADVPAPETEEVAVPVECIIAQPIDMPVTIEGYGETRSLRRITVAPEVPGRVTWTNEALVVGGLIPEGNTVLTIDSEPFEIEVNQAAAMVSERVTVIERLSTEWANDRERLQSLERRRDLAKQQFDRLNALMDDDVGTQEAIDFAEQAYVVAQDEVDQLADAIALYPIRIDEAFNALAMAQAELDATRVRLSKTEITAPFDARVSTYSVEKGQFIVTGQPVAELVDDSMVEIAVPLDSREARSWLRFNGHDKTRRAAWFGELERVPCTVTWTEAAGDGAAWTGHLDRVSEFDEDSRTVTVVIRVEGVNAAKRAGGLPLVEGMYCRVMIPGTTLSSVYAVPDASVTVDDTVYCVTSNRIESRPVRSARRAGGTAFIDQGLEPDDSVVTTRLIHPLERTLVSPTIVEPPDVP
jgi:RND family efflux transporter MFP subunit